MEEEIKDKTIIYLKRDFPCSAEDLFEAFLNETVFSKWFCPPGFEAGKFKVSPFVGGGYNCEFLRGGKYILTIKGKYVEINRFSSIVFTLMYEPDAADVGECRVSLKFNNSGYLTTLVLTQEIYRNIDSTGRTKGWEYMFGVLEKFFINKT